MQAEMRKDSLSSTRSGRRTPVSFSITHSPRAVGRCTRRLRNWCSLSPTIIAVDAREEHQRFELELVPFVACRYELLRPALDVLQAQQQLLWLAHFSLIGPEGNFNGSKRVLLVINTST